jgi:ABC-type branched-subunit amino acid transport system permease subunit
VLRYQLLFYGLVIAVFMVLLPDGFAGLVRRLARLAGRLGAQVRT